MRLLVVLVVVLLVVCGGIGFTAWRVVGDSTTAARANGQPSRPVAAAPAPVPSSAPPTSAPASVTPPPAPTGVPPGSAPIPFGKFDIVLWPDHLAARVRWAHTAGLPSTVDADRSYIAVQVQIEVLNYTGNNYLTVKQAGLRLFYGANRSPAQEFVQSAENIGTGFKDPIPSGGSEVAVFAFAVPPAGAAKLQLEFVPRAGDGPGYFTGAAE